MVNVMELVNSNRVMVTLMRDNTSTVNMRDMVYIFLLTGVSTRDNIKMVKDMEKEL